MSFLPLPRYRSCPDQALTLDTTRHAEGEEGGVGEEGGRPHGSVEAGRCMDISRHGEMGGEGSGIMGRDYRVPGPEHSRVNCRWWWGCKKTEMEGETE